MSGAKSFRLLAKSVNEKTAENDHNGAALELAEWLGCKVETQIMGVVIKHHEANGYMTDELIDVRRVVHASLMKRAKLKTNCGVRLYDLLD